MPSSSAIVSIAKKARRNVVARKISAVANATIAAKAVITTSVDAEGVMSVADTMNVADSMSAADVMAVVADMARAEVSQDANQEVLVDIGQEDEDDKIRII